MKRLDRSARAPLRNPIVRAGAAVGPGAVTAELEIAEMGARGDAAAAGPDGPIYLPYALPGERVRARYASDRGEVLAVLAPSAERQGAPCAHFGRCGGCQLQHWREEPYLAWKREQVVRALERRGIAAEVAAIAPAWGEGRRRATLHAGPGGAFGFIARGGAAITPVEHCPVLAPALQRALPGLRRLGQAFAPARGDLNIQALASETGVDVNVKGAGAPAALSAEAATRAAAIAEAEDFARLSFDGEPLAQRRAPVLTMGRARVAPPPGAFLQPTAQGEETLAKLVLEGLEGAACVADLFSGLGTFALRIAARAETHAYDGEEAMLAALRKAADHASGLKPVRATRRDLLRTPLSALEMKRFDAAVFDPPRSGARLQAEQIARSRVRKAVAVSCDPATFARDARALIDGGFSVARITPVDQFRWSPHIEIVGVFER